MAIIGVNNYSSYTNYNSKHIRKQDTDKTYSSTREYKNYLTEKYDCLRSKDYAVKINSSLLSKAMGDEKTKKWLEYNLAIIPETIEKTKTQVVARGAKILSCDISIDGYDSMTTELCTQVEADPGTEKTRKEQEERIAKKREEKKVEENKAEEKRREERLLASETIVPGEESRIHVFDQKV